MSARAAAEETIDVALVLQGGGALGAYQVGAYAALAAHGFHPEWIAGISIGAFNAAIIAGNAPGDRVAKLDAFWQDISWPQFVPPDPFAPLHYLQNTASYAEALFAGQRHFFQPRMINPGLLLNVPPDMVSFYDTGPLRGTLPDFAAFPLAKGQAPRVSLGATDIATGEITFFDTADTDLTPAHVLASGSLPPGFPATDVDGTYYWDGGCVANSPLDAIVNDHARPRMVAFMIDLWPLSGAVPENMSQALWRAKQIQYASRMDRQIQSATAKVKLRHAMHRLKLAGAPKHPSPRLDIVQIVYQPPADQIPFSDAEFSRSSIAERREAGHRDMELALKARPWLADDTDQHLGALVHRVQNGDVKTLPSPAFEI